MRKKHFKSLSFTGMILLVCWIIASPQASGAEKIVTSEKENAGPKTGLWLKEDSRYPLAVYVPDQYVTTRSYPLVISFPRSGETPEAHAKEWAAIVNRMSIMVMVPSVLFRPGETPFQADKWLLGQLKEITEHYKVARHKVFLLGEGTEAHYSAYLAVNHPEVFSGAALINGSWDGSFRKIMNIQKSPRKQVPFYVALRPDEALISETQHSASEFQSKGYLISMEKLGAQDSVVSGDFRRKVLEWLIDKSDAWQDVVKNSKRSWKEKLFSAVERNIKIEN